MTVSDQLCIHEIFRSIQGEGTRAGSPCTFVRLTGCPLRCAWCDTTAAHDQGIWMPLDDILSQIRSLGGTLVEVTGGEPLFQPACRSLLRQLADEFPTVLLETSGAVPLNGLDPRIIRIVDIKCPASGEAHRNHWPNLDLLTSRDEVKFVLADRADYDWAIDVIRRHALTDRCAILLTPAFGLLDPRHLAAWILADGHAVRLGLQLHKFIWPPNTPGV